MSDKMSPIPFAKLLNRCLKEFKSERSIFGIPESSFWKAPENSYAAEIFGRKLENVCGPAAGPHTQLAQNIVAAYLCGARFFELKTVQKLDGEDLPVSKPCIWAKDETFNVEWSTELLVPQAMNEYIKAWFLLHILGRELELGSSGGFIFNMSLGYDLEGIKLPKIDNFIEGMKDASKTAIFAECVKTLRSAVAAGEFQHTDSAFIDRIPARICGSVTLSTLHGCPPAEIERIASYLLTEKELDTFIKCNPTLLGYDEARNLLDKLGFTNLHFGTHHFEHDLQFADAIPLLERMQKLAEKQGKTFGVKLTNTFPVQIVNKELPGSEMYLSGKALYPLSLYTALKLSRAFAGNLRISFSGGADAVSIRLLCETGMYPITLATSLLKPGGYERLNQLAVLCTENRGSGGKINLDQLERLCENLLDEKRNFRPLKSAPRLKIKKQVPLTDCFAASCKKTCPIEQDIPEYIAAASRTNYEEALRIITQKNPLPFITGTICNHRCTASCVRHDYEQAVNIRGIKLLCAQKGMSALLEKTKPVPLAGCVKVAVVGAGPAGLAAAYFLRRAGIAVTVFEREKKAGGLVSAIIPGFRIAAQTIERDIEWIAAQGIKFTLGRAVGEKDLAGFDYTVLAVGAWKAGFLELDSDKPPLKCLDFLAQFSQNPAKIALGKTVAVIGAGNSAMDACRAAIRVPGVTKVSLVYRRTKEQMPADAEELAEALSEGAEFLELLAPVSHRRGKLICEVCELGEPDASGRRSPVKTGKTFSIDADTVISAVGEKIDTEALAAFGVKTENGKPLYNPQTLETAAKNVFLAGDVRSGPATIVEAIADAQKAAGAIIGKVTEKTAYNAKVAAHGISENCEIKARHGVLEAESGIEQESGRCFTCNIRCGVCAEVCPNRANLLITAAGKPQIVHLDSLCNECGNCEGFCPYESAPYLEKFTYFANEQDFADSSNAGFTLADSADGKKAETVTLRLDGRQFSCAKSELSKQADADICAIIEALQTHYAYVL